MGRFLRAWTWRVGLLVLCGLCVTCTQTNPYVGRDGRVVFPMTPESDFVPTATRGLAETPVPAVSPTPSLVPGPGLGRAGVRVFPTPLYTGDVASFDVLPRLSEGHQGDLTVTVQLPHGGVSRAPVFAQGLDNVPRARFYWVWPAPVTAGRAWLTFTLSLSPDLLDPDLSDNVLVLPVDLRTPTHVFTPDLNARWVWTKTEGVRLHYLTHTAAERDLPLLLDEARSAYASVTERFTATARTIDVYMLDRVLGQGGYASNGWVAVSYTDRHYAPGNLSMVLRHELVHRLDGAIGCHESPIMLREGLAVYSVGGHYWEESLPLNMAALLQMDRYIPLEQLVENFYTHQHEIGYLEAGALVAYVVEHWGWASVERLCQEMGNNMAMSDQQRLDAGLRAVLGLTLADFERQWLVWVKALHPSEQIVALLQAEWHLMDSVRAYQAQFDPGANFLLGMFFNPAQGAQRAITTNFVRQPRSAEAIALELLLIEAQRALLQRNPTRAEAVLDEIGDVLATGFPESGRAADGRAIVSAALARDYEPYQLVANEDGSYLVYVLDYNAWPEKRILAAGRTPYGWRITGPQSTLW